ncbi:MAG TPA: transcriptional regulator NrdR [Limnochordia bacterium]|nr:transcriptional regulator NrdR [Limnochordia bacterium]
MKCPFCSYSDSRVLESRPTEEGSAIRRRRECLSCRERFTTYERVETVPLMVIKKDGTRQEFDRSKILQGVIKACEKRPVPLARLEQMVNDIEQRLRNSMEQEVSSKTIGEMVMNELKQIDQVAYVRFASVYRQFKDIQSFLEELQTLLRESDV